MSTFLRYPFAAPVEVYRNLVTNPSFEVDLSGWTVFAGSPTIARVPRTPTASSGDYALRLTAALTSNMEVVSAQMPASPGVTYTATGSMQRSTVGRNNAIQLRFYDASDVLIGSVFTGSQVMSTGAWQTVSSTALSPAGTAFVRVLVRTYAPAVGELHYWDQISLVATASVLPYFDGNTGYVGGMQHRWLGAVNLSASVAESPGVADEISPDLSIAKPFRVTRAVRSVARPLLDSSTVRAVLFEAGPRRGAMTTVWADSAAGMEALSFFSGARTFRVTDEAYASFWFVVSESELDFEQDTAPGVVTIPFVEVSSP